MSDFRSIPRVTNITDANLRSVLIPIKEDIEIGHRKIGDIRDSFVRVSDLVGLGLLGVDGNTLYDPNAAAAAEFSSDTSRSSDGSELDAIMTWDVSADATVGAVGTHNLGFVLPINSYITRAWYEVDTTFTDVGGTGKIRLQVETDDTTGLTGVTTLLSSGDWNAGLHSGVPTGATGTFTTKTTAARNIQAVVAVEAMTAGKLDLFIKYVTI